MDSVVQADREPLLLSWSGGKDCALALHVLRQTPGVEVIGLLTTITEDSDRISVHGVRRVLLEQQAEAAGLPLQVVLLPRECTNEQYEARLADALRGYQERGGRQVAFGDLFLEDVRAYREHQLAAAGLEGLFPLWGRDTSEMARDLLRLGFAATLVCVDTEALPASFAGRPFDAALLRDLPPGADPCGEKGEFHTFVHAAPVFSEAILVRLGEVEDRGRFVYRDLLSSHRTP